MRFIDTHAHLNFAEFKTDYREVIARAKQFGVDKIIIPGTDPNNTARAVEIANQFDGVYATLGAHPLHLKGGFSLEIEDGMPPSLLLESYDGSYSSKCSLADFRAMAESDDIIAIGEIGLDYKKNSLGNVANSEVQVAALKAIIKTTIDLVKPYIFHCRPAGNSDKAFKDLYLILEHNFKTDETLKGVVHCFAGNYFWFKKFRRLGFLVSYTGLITNTDEFNKTIEQIPLEGLLIETDSPYLSPRNSKSNRSEPVDVIAVAEKIAEIKNISLEKVAQATTSKAEELFKI
jgi:TatD DNase family protein